MVEVMLVDAICVRVGDVETASTDGGLLFNVTDIQSDMLRRFRFNFTDSFVNSDDANNASTFFWQEC